MTENMTKIERMRWAHYLSRAEVAKAVNVKPSTVIAWEKRRAHPNGKTLRKLAILFECSMDELVEPFTEEELREVREACRKDS